MLPVHYLLITIENWMTTFKKKRYICPVIYLGSEQPTRILHSKSIPKPLPFGI